MNKDGIITDNKELINIYKLKFNIYMGVKRFVDIICSIFGMLFLIPLTIFVKIASVMTGDFNSIFFMQERIGKDGVPFKLYKYRTMVPNADKILKKLMKENNQLAEEYNKYKKLENDPRITKVGNLLRKFSLDEFPQFINIFKGDMSLVGPRPYLYREKKDMGKYFNIIKQAKPGLTGYWQVNGRNNTDFKERLLLDEEYMKIRGLSLDLKIFFMTFAKVLKRDGAK
jgi:undecaprenyl-phosphate galactose phosphotransferase